jgi:hypothetical protein
MPIPDSLTRESFDAPGEIRKFDPPESGYLELVADGTVGRATFNPGWKWSENIKPIAGTDSCEQAHVGYFISGQMHVVSDDGTEMDYGPGDFATMAPGHDAWVVGTEPCVVLDWTGFATYAQPQA